MAQPAKIETWIDLARAMARWPREQLERTSFGVLLQRVGEEEGCEEGDYEPLVVGDWFLTTEDEGW